MERKSWKLSSETGKVLLGMPFVPAESKRITE